MRVSIFLTGLLWIVSTAAQSETVNIQAKNNYSGSWTSRQVKLLDLIPGYTSVNDGANDFTRYGSYRHHKTNATGFFYVEKIDGRWWLVDPEGFAGINMAVTSMPATNIQRNYDLIVKNGFNGSGSFLDNESQTSEVYNEQNYREMSYTRRLNFFLSYRQIRPDFYETPEHVKGSLNHVYVLDPQFAIYCDEVAQSNVTPFADEKNLLGWFTDNEINFNQDQLRNLIVDLPEGDPSRQAAEEFALNHGVSLQNIHNNSIPNAVKEAFAVHLAEHYYKTVSEAIRKFDANHLILGSRLHGRPRAIQGVVDASHQYMDVTSVNFYDRFAPSEQITQPSWMQDHPIIIGEFYIKDINIFDHPQPGAGWYVNSQRDRGYYYQNTCLEFLESKNVIGWHYFRFQDDPDSNKGLVASGSSPEAYYEMTQYVEQLNKQVYRLADFYDGVNRRTYDQTYAQKSSVSKDTYVYVGASNDNTFGDAADLEVFYFWNESNRREAFFKFELHEELKVVLDELVKAELVVQVTESNQNSRYVLASGVRDNSWHAETFSGVVRAANAEWSSTGNRLDFASGVIPTAQLRFDVTHWLLNESDAGLVSFKLHDVAETGNPLKVASGNHPDEALRPFLQLTLMGEDVANSIGGKSIQEALNTFIDRNGSIVVDNYGSQFTSYQIISISGKVVKTGLLNPNSHLINAASLGRGAYLLRLTGDTQAVRKLMLP